MPLVVGVDAGGSRTRSRGRRATAAAANVRRGRRQIRTSAGSSQRRTRSRGGGRRRWVTDRPGAIAVGAAGAGRSEIVEAMARGAARALSRGADWR